MGKKMIEVRFHGTGGQGAVVASFHEGSYVRSFPVFGVEMQGHRLNIKNL